MAIVVSHVAVAEVLAVPLKQAIIEIRSINHHDMIVSHDPQHIVVTLVHDQSHRQCRNNHLVVIVSPVQGQAHRAATAEGNSHVKMITPNQIQVLLELKNLT